jgi:hypothetical protein
LQTTWMPRIAGILSIISGVIGISGGIIIAVVAGVMRLPAEYLTRNGIISSHPVIIILIIIFVLFNIVAIAGGISAIKRKRWAFAVLGAVCSIFNIWSCVLGIGALVFLIQSRSEFKAITASQKPITAQNKSVG